MIAAVDAQYERATGAVACVTFHDWADPVAASEHSTLVHAIDEYMPGEFWRRELPCILAVLRLLPRPPQIVLIDGYVWLDNDGRKGMGAHLFDALHGSTAVVGVAKRPFRGAPAALVHRGGSLRPLHVTAQGLPAAAAEAAILSMHGRHRIPTLLKRVDQVSRQTLRERPPA
jgi:deoxyribonuclease V